MTWPVFRRVLATQWLLVGALTLVGLAAGAVHSVVTAPVYSSTSQLFVTLETAGSDLATDDDGLLYVQERLPTYAHVVTSRPVLLRVAQELGPRGVTTVDPEALADRIHVSRPEGTTVLDIEARGSSPGAAGRTARATAEAAQAVLPGLEIPSDAGSRLQVVTTDPASTDPAPISPVRAVDLALGLLAGLALGLAVGALRVFADTRVRSVGELQALTGTLPLGVVPFDERTSPRTRAREGGRSGHGEALRTIRSNLRFMAAGSPQLIVVTSPRGGDGRTRTACDLAITLAETGARVALVDADLRGPHGSGLGATLGLSDASGLTSVLAGAHDLGGAMVPYGVRELWVLPCGPTPPNPAELLGSRQAAAVFAELRERYDHVVVDSPSLRVTDASLLARTADAVVLVARHGRTRTSDVVSALRTIGSAGGAQVGTVLNAAPVTAPRDHAAVVPVTA